MEDQYFVIKSFEGETYVTMMSKQELLNTISQDGSGYKPDNVITVLGDRNTAYWGDDFLIIKGRMVVPNTKMVVTKYDIE